MSSTIVEEKLNPSIVKKIHREVRFGNYILGSTLGEGEFGKVKLGWRKDGKLPNQVAIKLIKRETLSKDTESEIKTHREINSLKLLSHPNIVNLVEVMKSGKYIGIVLEYASGGELFDYILNHKYLKEPLAKKFFAQLVSGVDYMHSKGLIHRDLKLENLLLDKNKNIIISDFGFVNSYNLSSNNDLMKTSCGSPCYAAPELVLTPNPYNGKKVDIWSLGVILYAMLAGYLPFDDDPSNEDGSDIIRLYHYICKTPLTFPEYITPLPRDLLRKIIVADPKKRININEIRNHTWLSSYANLLSIRQPEWDKIYKDKQTKSISSTTSSVNPSVSRSQNASKRFSMINEPTNSAQLTYNAFKKQHGRSTSSGSASNIFMSSNTSIDEHNEENIQVGTVAAPGGNKISTIIESPKRHPLSVINDTTFSINPNTTIPIPIAISNSEKPVDAGAKAIHSSTSRLPHQPKKPRPTSYHPSSSYSAYNSSNPSALDFRYPSPINIPISQFLPPSSGSTPKNSPPKGSPPKSDIESLSLSSRRNSVVTAINVNGVLTRDNSEKRNSVLIYLEDRMNNIDLAEREREPETTVSTSPIMKVTTHVSVAEEPASTAAVPSVEKIVEPTPRIRERSDKVDKETKRRNRFSLLSIYSNYSTSQVDTTLVQADSSRRKPDVDKPKASVSNSSSSLVKRNKEVSAAKKVMDFFKRRSIRVT
ncbi:hypothetical protein PSN45_003514 [Yamadazyma tenuis]|nr:hypothetical protein PSN45_003514 [Yamadazyma tenuis]